MILRRQDILVLFLLLTVFYGTAIATPIVEIRLEADLAEIGNNGDLCHLDGASVEFVLNVDTDLTPFYTNSYSDNVATSAFFVYGSFRITNRSLGGSPWPKGESETSFVASRLFQWNVFPVPSGSFLHPTATYDKLSFYLPAQDSVTGMNYFFSQFSIGAPGLELFSGDSIPTLDGLLGLPPDLTSIAVFNGEIWGPTGSTDVSHYEVERFVISKTTKYPIPEPNTLVLVGLGIIGMGWLRRRNEIVGYPLSWPK